VHRIIYDELWLGVVREESRQAYRAAIVRLVQAGADGVVLGCTEIELLVCETDSPVPVFPTTRLHVEAPSTLLWPHQGASDARRAIWLSVSASRLHFAYRRSRAAAPRCIRPARKTVAWRPSSTSCAEPIAFRIGTPA